MKKLLLVVLMLSTLFGKSYWNQKMVNSYRWDFKTFNSYNLKILKKVYKFGKEYDIGLTMMAICWEESHAGDYMFNELTGDYGLQGINLKYYMKRHNINTTNIFIKNKLASRLIRDDQLNMVESLVVLTELVNRFKNKKNKWMLIWGAYNAGPCTPNMSYAQRILLRIIVLKENLNKIIVDEK